MCLCLSSFVREREARDKEWEEKKAAKIAEEKKEKEKENRRREKGDGSVQVCLWFHAGGRLSRSRGMVDWFFVGEERAGGSHVAC